MLLVIKKALAGLTRRAARLRISSGKLNPSSPVRWQELVMVDGGSFFDDHTGDIVSPLWVKSSRDAQDSGARPLRFSETSEVSRIFEAAFVLSGKWWYTCGWRLNI
jgi:hypothetical protein